MNFDEDFALALQLQEQFINEINYEKPEPEFVKNSHTNKMPDIKYNENSNKKNINKEASIVDPSWEYVDPTPDIHALFIQFDNRFFWGKLKMVEVSWSQRMTLCAGLCRYEGLGGLCSVRLSLPLLKLRPRKDLVETLLHEMIHAFLFVTHNNRDREGHGPEFCKHMHRINKEAGTNITIFHSFHNEVKIYQQHWWRCDGPCQKKPPFFGILKRCMNRAPCPTDFWWKEHQATCGGRYVKVHEPPGFSEKKAKQASKKGVLASSGGKTDIRNCFPFHGKGNILGNGNTDGVGGTNRTFGQPLNKSHSPVCGSMTNNVTGFRDLFSRNTNSAKSYDRLKTNDSSKTFANPSKQNGGSFSGSIPEEPAFGDKAHSPSYENKDAGRPGRFVGTLANRGGGTLVITAKGNNKGTSNIKTINGNLNDGNKTISNFVPFFGKGHTLGAGSEIRGVSNGRKFGIGTVASNSVKNRVLRDDSLQSLSNRTLPEEVTALKRHGSAIRNDVSKRMKNGSVLDFVTDYGEYSASNGDPIKCPVCNSDITELDINTHLDSCLGTYRADDEPKVNENCSANSETDSERIECPACNLELLKSDLNIHLDMCLGGVFDDASVDNDDDCWDHKSPVSTKPGGSMYPCPCCATLVRDTEMNLHLDHCLAETA